MTVSKLDFAKEVRVIDLFCGIGGLTHGLIKEGFNVVAGFDIDPTCKFAYETNNNSRFYNKDIESVCQEEINSLFGDARIKILVGCAPCQPFSKYTQKQKNKKDEMWTPLNDFLRIVLEMKPDILSMENVPNLIKYSIFENFVNSLRKNGYFVEYNIVYCPDYGIPQKRKRLVLLASRMGDISLIPPTHLKEKYSSVKEVIGNLPLLEDGETHMDDLLHRAAKLNDLNKKRILSSVQGGTWRDWNEKLKLRCHRKKSGKSYPSVYGRMNWNEPSPTITTQFYGFGNGRFGHPEQNRALSLREGALLQTFPLTYEFINPLESPKMKVLGKHIGNAVPVELGRTIGISIKKHYQERSGLHVE